MSSEKKKFQWKPNIFDAAVVILGIAVMALILLVLRPTAAHVDRTESLEYTIELQNMPEGTWQMIQVGDNVSDNAKKLKLGKVVSVEVKPYTMSMAKADGSAVVESVVPRAETVLVTLRSDMVITDKEISTSGGFTIRVGTDVYLGGPGYAGTGYVVAIERGEE